MSHWNIGIDDVSQTTHAYRDKLASKDSQIAAQETKLLKQAADIEDLQKSLDDALHKLTAETNRVLHLESKLAKSCEDLRNEQITSENAANALESARKQFKEKDSESRELLSHLESLSHQSSSQSSQISQLEKEKTSLTNRVRELEVNLSNLSSPPVTPARRAATRPRSSSLSDIRIDTLELELEEVRARVTAKDLENRTITERWRSEMMQLQNSSACTERALRKRVAELEGEIDEKDEEIDYLRSNGDSVKDREEELLKRIDEDDATINALEKLLGDAATLKEALTKVRQQLETEQRTLSDSQSRQAELVREKEEATDELEECREKIQSLERALEERDTLINTLKSNVSTLRAGQTSPGMMNIRHAMPDPDMVDNMERMLGSIKRLRQERDDLRRHLKFLEMEHKFNSDELEKLRSMSPQATPSNAHPHSGTEHSTLAITALTVIVAHLSAQYSSTLDLLSQRDEAVKGVTLEAKKLSHRHATSLQDLEEAIADREALQKRLQAKQQEWERNAEESKSEQQEMKDALQHLEAQVGELSSATVGAESERDSLRLQVENLNTDLASARSELQGAEDRYSSLQFHQLSNMSSDEATRALMEQIEELEKRVIRRTEQIGLHQHDIKRMETNLRLQEERISELMGDLDTVAAEKNAMVEDCADAREARDAAFVRCDNLEIEAEALREEAVAVETLVHVVFDLVGQSRMTIRRMTSDSLHAKAQIDRLELEYQQSQRSLEETTASLQSCQQKLSQSQSDTKQATVALASSQIEVQRLMSSGRALEDAQALLENRIAELQEELTARMSERDAVANELEDLRRDLSIGDTSWAARTTELERQLVASKDFIASMELSHREALKELQDQVSEKERHLVNSSVEQEHVVQLRMKHAEELGELRSLLVETTSLLEETKTRHEACQAERREALVELDQAKVDIRKHTATIDDGLARSMQLTQELEEVNGKWKAETMLLADRAAELQIEVTKVAHSRDSLEAEYREKITSGQHEMVQQIDHMREELSSLREQILARTAELAEASKATNSVRSNLDAEIQGRISDRELHASEVTQWQERYRALEELNAELGRDVDNVNVELNVTQEQLDALQEELTEFQQANTALEAQVQRELSLTRYLESQVKDLKCNLSDEAAQHAETRATLTRIENSAKNAEVNYNMLSSKHRREMSQVQRELIALRNKPDLDSVVGELEERNNEMEELLRAKCAEIEENDDKTLEMLKENKKLASRVESLTRKVQNLQAKLAAAKASIPAKSRTNDEMSSVPSSSVTSTTSSYCNPMPPAPHSRSSTLSNPAETTPIFSAAPSRPSSRTSPHDPSSSSSSSSSSSRVTPSPTQQPPSVPRQRSSTLAPASLPPDAPSSISRTLNNRMASGPSSLPRSKTPERRAFSAFRPPSPEKSSLPQSSSKKRALQEDPAPLPAQAFTADGLMDTHAESGTPRLHKVMNSIQSGFTPMRHKTSRPIISLSPKRLTATTPFMSDVTNDPQLMEEKSSQKRSWLGKIRSTTTSQGANTPSSQAY